MRPETMACRRIEYSRNDPFRRKRNSGLKGSFWIVRNAAAFNEAVLLLAPWE